ncbi:adenosylcobinamide amidohydrolase [Streptomyces sp. URMC 123]|uniref:adenosylcobinamide amidohydrolase n=1 Tax=Streptomyces sp. URMC 123 TaxID=3423403 RepID=UPI003F1AFF3B
MVSSAVLGGGMGDRSWVLNAQVPHGYRGTDPVRDLALRARAAGLEGEGVGLMTAAEVGRFAHGEDGGVEAVVTAGLGVTGWAASPAPGRTGPPPAGTVNIIAALPVALSDAALVNAVATATEAKVQALLDAGYDCSGTPTDAVCVASRSPRAGCDLDNGTDNGIDHGTDHGIDGGVDSGAAGEVEAFAGPRSLWGARLARAVHRAVHAAALAARDNC